MKYLLIVTVLALIGCLVAGDKKPPTKRQKAFEKGKCIDDKRKRQICIKARGESGKMLMSMRGNRSDADAFVLVFDFIRELDEDLQIIKGRAKHSLESFARTEFEFSELEETTVKGVAAYKFDFLATLDGPGATLTVEVYIIKEKKEIALCDTNIFTVIRSSIKFNIKIEGWQFCGIDDYCGKANNTGKNVTGKYIDFGIKLQGRVKGKKPEKQDRKDKGGDAVRKDFKIDGELSLVMPTAVDIDDSCGKMPEGYPQLSDDGVLTTFRFPVFKKMILYDPFMTADEEESGAQSAAANLSFVLIALLAAFTQLLY